MGILFSRENNTQDELHEINGLDLDEENAEEEVSLCKAVQLKRLDLVKSLLNSPGADAALCTQDNSGRTPTCIAAELGDSEVLSLLREHSPPHAINIQDNELQTPLIIAARQGNVAIVQSLLAWDPAPDVNSKDCAERTALFIAVQHGYSEIVQLLAPLTSPPCINGWDREGDAMLVIASSKGYAEIVETLCNTEDIDVNIRNRLDGFDSAFEDAPLHCAIENNHVEVVKILLRKPEVDLDALDHRGMKALHSAAADSLDALEILLGLPGADVNVLDRWKCTPLYSATAAGSIDAIQVLLEIPDVDVNAQNSRGDTALHCACALGNIEAVGCLLAAESLDTGIQNHEGKTALWRAVENGHVEIVETLLQLDGIAASTTNYKGETLLHAAVSQGEFLVVHLLMTAMPYLGAECESGQTALHKAASGTGSEMVLIARMLLQSNDIEIDKIDERGDTALDLACQNRGLAQQQEALVRLLLENGAMHATQIGMDDARTAIRSAGDGV